ncbi:MAG: helix-turn-helix transcriptional regulator [Spirochaetales bacterium]|nr:helix-turn-helix transcriptional regulator [Spirochaetales bacterium]
MNIKYYRQQKGFSQWQLAILCDCGNGTIGGIESGKSKPSFDLLVKIAEALKVNPADLFIRDVSKSKDVIKNDLKNKFKELNKIISDQIDGM